MHDTTPLPWLEWARRLQAISQTGLTYSSDPYDTERFQQIAAIAAEIVARHTQLPAGELERYFMEQPGYATPKVDVRGAVVVDEQILLVQERSDQRWCLPGGWADVGETPSEMVVREVWEESGLTVVPRKLVGIYDANRQGERLELAHAYKLVFLCQPVGGQLRPSAETMAARFFAFDQLPALSANRTDQRHLAAVRAHLADPARATDFD